MSGLKYLLDTNFILGLMKSDPSVLGMIASQEILASECAYSSAVTRMELLGYPGITDEEAVRAQTRLAQLTHVAVTRDIEDAALALRRLRRVKLPDAIIAATARCRGLELLTLDIGLRSVARCEGA
jgi:predicted nucleic acid-binding protein